MDGRTECSRITFLSDKIRTSRQIKNSAAAERFARRWHRFSHNAHYALQFLEQDGGSKLLHLSSGKCCGW